MSKPAPIRRKRTRHHEARTLEVITPIFGGGTTQKEAGEGSQFKEIDPVTPVRVPSIRGQLRYWWRATTGAWLDTVAVMRERESQLFGAASVPGDLALYLSDEKITVRQEEVFELRPNKTYCNPISGKDGLAYGAFSLNPQDADRRNGHINPGKLTQLTGSFQLNWTCSSEFADEVRLAVHAWIAFGGIGGRTTRGFGQVWDAENSTDYADEVLQQICAKGLPQLGAQIPAIDPKAVLRFKSGSSPNLNTALNHLRAFRQGRDVGRNPGQGQRPGRSRWPEPDAIRRITRRHSRGHAPDQVYGRVEKFPRAAFGMPIIFHFKDAREEDPDTTSLQPVDRERMRSPLQISLSQDGSITYLIMTAPRPGRIELKNTREVEHHLAENERALLAQRAGDVFTDTDPLRAFLKYVQCEVGHDKITIAPEF